MILKWAGGKRRLVPQILELLPEDYRERSYHEPFFGSGAVFFALSIKKGTINDINEKLMNFYRVVRDNPKELIEMAKPYKYDKDEYYMRRDRFNEEGLDNIEMASLLLYLNKTGYNGMYRVNSKGKFNIPFGRYTNPTIVPIEKIQMASVMLQTVDIKNDDFTYVLLVAEKGDICYLDPPYQPLSKSSSFTTYAKKGFVESDQDRVSRVCKTLDEMGVLFVLSNSSTEENRKRYEAFNISVVQMRRSLNRNVEGRGAIDELLITNIG